MAASRQRRPASAPVPVIRAEDVDVVEVGQDESVWAKSGRQVSEQ
jgi:hypothetical protein